MLNLNPSFVIADLASRLGGGRQLPLSRVPATLVVEAVVEE